MFFFSVNLFFKSILDYNINTQTPTTQSYNIDHYTIYIRTAIHHLLKVINHIKSLLTYKK